MSSDGRILTLSALSGAPTERTPAGIITWGYDYYWKVAGVEAWQLCRGSEAIWQHAHRSLYERHRPDILFYSGSGTGPKAPRLIEDEREHWIIEDGNTGRRSRLLKSSLTEVSLDTGRKRNDPVGEIRSPDDADRLIPAFDGLGESYLRGLGSLIDFCGDNALVLPHHSPGYFNACSAFGFMNAMAMMIENPELFFHVADRYAEGDEPRMRQLAEAGAEAVFIADSWASTDIISPRMFRTFALPYQQSVINAARKHGLLTILWNVGDVIPLLRDEASIPWDAFGIEQTRKGIELDLADIRESFGPARCIMGNLDSETLLISGTRAQITAAVDEQLQKNGKGNPFILCTGSPVPSDASIEAVDAMLEYARKQ